MMVHVPPLPPIGCAPESLLKGVAPLANIVCERMKTLSNVYVIDS